MFKSYNFFFFIVIWVLSCNQAENIKIADGKVEGSLSKHTGVTTKMVKLARAKTSLGLNDLYILAVEQTERIAIKEEALTQAKAQKHIAIASWIPSLSFRHNRNYTIPNHDAHDREVRNRDNLVNAILNPTPQAGTTTTTSSTISQLNPSALPGDMLQLTVPVMTGLNEYSAFKNAKELINVRRYEAEFEAARLYLELAQLYFTILQIERSIKVKKDIQKITKGIVRELKRRVRLGKSRKSELLNAQSQFARVEADLLKTEDNLQTQRASLATKTGVNPNTPLIEPEEWKSSSLSLEQALKKVEERADVKAAEYSMKVADSNLTKAWGGHLPTISLNSYYRLPRHNVPHNKDIFTQFVVQIPLLSAGTITASVKQAESAKRQAELTLSQTKRMAVEDVQTAYKGYKNSKGVLSAYREALDAAELSHRVQKQDYSQQLSTTLDLFNSLNSLHNAKNDYNTVLLQKELNRIWLGVATGEIPERKSDSKGDD
ncbi:MAG: TolC family protein [Leptospiraceae bacterium]|nr:TolC family protein [Leptospiraceae bacterium]